jgi:D-threo-aldose 1-dehydrogenase
MTAPLASRPLGRTGLAVTALGFGCAPLGELYARIDERTAQGALAAAYAGGIRLFDTAPLYGHGLAEHRLGAALRYFDRDDVVVSTKVGRVMDPRARRDAGSGYAGGLTHRAVFDYSYDGALRSLDQSLLRLATDRVEIALIHDVDVHTHGRAAIDTRFAEAMDGAYRALDDLRREGVVRAIGVGVNEADVAARFLRAGDFDCVLLAGRYTLLEQGALDDFLPLAATQGVGVLLGGVFNSGILASGAVDGAKYNYRNAPPEVLDRVRRIGEVCRAHGVALPVAALHFALAHPAVAALVLGAVSAGEVTRNVDALAQRVPAALWRDLAAAGLLRSDAPLPA